MIPVQVLFERPFVLLCSDTLQLNDAACAIALIKEPFTPSPVLTFADVTPADFGGYAELEVGAVPPLESIDPVDGAALIDILPPAGGWRWETTNTTNLPQTIFGFCLRNADDDLIASETLSTPVVLDGVNQTVVLDRVTLRLPAGAIS